MSEIDVHPLKKARKMLNLSQEDVAVAILRSVSTIKRAEDDQPLDDDVILEICKYFSEAFHREVTSEELRLKRRRKTKATSNSDTTFYNEEGGEKENTSERLETSVPINSLSLVASIADSEQQNGNIYLQGIASPTTSIAVPEGASIFVVHNGTLSMIEIPSSQIGIEEVPPALAELEKDVTDMDRREFLHESFKTAKKATGAMLFTPAQNLLLAELSELSERFTRAIKNPSTIDENFLGYLDKRSQGLWTDHYTVALPSRDLFNYAKEHFEKITALLEEPLSPTARTHLYSTASKTALLIGTLLYDMKAYVHARMFFKDAILAADEANLYTLQALGWGWISFTWTYNKDIRSAHSCVQKAIISRFALG